MPENLPYMQFYPADWLADCDVLSMGTRGAWNTFLCKAWMARSPSITLKIDKWARAFGAANVKQAQQAIDEIEECNIGDVIREDDGRITIVSRRIERDLKTRGATKKKQSEAAGNAARIRWEKHNAAKVMQGACVSHAKGNADAMPNDAILEARSQKLDNPPKPPRGRSVEIPELYKIIIRCITPNCKFNQPRDKAEMTAWKRVKDTVTIEDAKAVERFYRLRKSKNQDFTWNRKTGVAALLNQWTSQVEYAQSMKFKRLQIDSGPPRPKRANVAEPANFKELVPEAIYERGWNFLCTNDHDTMNRVLAGERIETFDPAGV
jgi:uncharacterized protein YdaU (DUF1376 family)